ncbi:MAG: hypothetical protein ACFB0B_20645 [Thermonemataceae bacterium]
MCNNHRLFTYLLAFTWLFLTACGAETQETEEIEDTEPTEEVIEDETEEDESDATAIKISSARTEAIIVKDAANNQEMVKVQVVDPSTVQVSFGGMSLTGEAKGEKRKYKDDTDFTILEIKSKEPQKMKLNTNDGRMLWKLKISGSKIKISNNEEGENPFELKQNDEGKIKVKYQGKELGSVQLSEGKVKIKKAEEEAFTIATDQNSYAFALMVIDEIPAEEKYVLMAELLARGL